MCNQFICGLFFLMAAATSIHAAAIKGSDNSYLVSIQGRDGQRICVGALIDDKTVVTVATCLAFYDADRFVVAVDNGARIIEIANKRFNPYFDFVTMENDIALLKLAEPVSASYLELPSKQPESFSNGTLIRLDANNTIRVFAELILSIKDCASENYKYEEDDLYDTMVCGLPANADACGGPVGSPLVLNSQLVGLESWGFGCANKGEPAIFTDVYSLRSWIEATSEKLNK